jgi:ribosome-associated protein
VPVDERVEPSGLQIADGLIVPLAEIELRTSRSSGPGGQHANVTASRVEAVFDIATSPSLPAATRARLLERLGPQATAVAQDERSQYRNRALALERLRDRLADALYVPPQRRPTRPGRAAKARRLDAKRAQSARKQARRTPEAE